MGSDRSDGSKGGAAGTRIGGRRRPRGGGSESSPEAPEDASYSPSKQSVSGPTGRPDESLVIRIGAALQSLRDGRIPLPFDPQVSALAFALAAQANPRPDAVWELIESDPALESEILAAASEGHTAAACEPANLDDAMQALEPSGVLDLVQVALMHRLHRVDAPGYAEPAAAMWRCSRVVAGATQRLAEAADVEPRAGYLVALLHNVGEVVVLRALGAIAAEGGPSVPDAATLARICGSIHERVGERFLALWGAPRDLCALARAHHTRPRHPEPPSVQVMRRLVLRVWKATVAEGLGYAPLPSDIPVDALRARRPEVFRAVREVAESLG